MDIDDDHVVPSGHHYSGRNRIPNLYEVMDRLDQNKRQRDAEIDAQIKAELEAGRKKQQEDRKEREAELQNQKRKAKGGSRMVKDPITGGNVEIEDVVIDSEEAVEKAKISVPNDNMGEHNTMPVTSDLSGEEYRRAQDITAPPAPIHPGSTSDVPIRNEKTSVLFYKTPSVSYEPMFEALEQRGQAISWVVAIAIIIVGKACGASLLGIVPLGLAVGAALFLWVKEVIRSGRENEWKSERDRGESATVNLIPESVEWMNTALGVIWQLINPEMFAGVADTLEDVMAASVPGIIDNVRVADISQGSNPLRIISLRALPDSHVQDIQKETYKKNKENTDPHELAAMEKAGAFYNLEASVAYHSMPSGDDISSKSKNIGMQLVFYMGIKGLFGIPLPIWVELNSLVSTVRFRFQMMPEPPFLKTVTMSLMGIPRVGASCTPMIEKGVNVLNLPLISNFVNWAIGAAASMYVAPKSLTLDLGKILQGDDIQKETLALGVLFIRISKATDLSKQDARGSKGGGSDPYITVAWSKFSKPQFCTRVIQDDLNPVFEESCGLLVTPDILHADEKLSMELWDSDRASADDVVGKVVVSVRDLVQTPGKTVPMVSSLQGLHADSEMPGKLHWEVGFFGRTPFDESLRTDGKDPSVPENLRDKDEFQDEKGAIENEEEDAVTHTPPDPRWPSGILSVVVHQIVGLEMANIKGSNGRRRGREYESARPEAGEVKEEEHKKLPSSYCTILMNDDLVYKTRTKVVSSQPIFNAGSERFVRDWRSCIVTICVRDSRHREHDPIIGVVPLKIPEILQASSQVTRWYPLRGGIGFGRVRISLLFRSVDLKLPPKQLGWEVGTFEFTSNSIQALHYNPSTHMKLHLRTGGSSASIKGSACSEIEDGSGVAWDVSGENSHEKIRLPVRNRYRSPIFFEIFPPGKRHARAFASFWLCDIVDMEDTDFDIPIWRCDNAVRLSQNYITETNYRDIPNIDLEEIGRLKFRGRFVCGTDKDHIRFVRDNNTRETIETWETCYAEGTRTEAVQLSVPPITRKSRDEPDEDTEDTSELENREKQRWITKEGTDWSMAFGEDPANLMNTSGYTTSNSIDEDEEDEYSTEDTNTSNSTPQTPSDESEPKRTMSRKETNRDLNRKHRGVMQWRAVRNVQFAKDEALFALRRIRDKGRLNGRKPDVETEV